jgi:hypothetical protein
MSVSPRSTRQPWVRSGLMGLVPLLLPFVWVLEINSCGNAAPATTEITGTMVVGHFELEGWLLIVPVVLLVLLTPFAANRLAREGLRVLVHVLGLVATALAGWGATMAMLFTIFSEREAKGVGWVVLACFGGALLDALLRVVWSTQEWLKARALAKAPPASG